MANSETVFVTGATGKQGGSVARVLSQHGFHLIALTRKTDSDKSRALKKLDIQVVSGDLNDTASYRDYLKGAYGIFSVQTFEQGVDKEIRQGIGLATVAKEFGVRHFLYSSVYGADLNTGVPHIDRKFRIENHIKQIGLPFTILRPTSFYENFLIPQVKKGILNGKMAQPVNRETVMQYMAAEDIGKVAVKIFQNQDLYLNRIIPLAAEQLNALEVCDLFSTVLKKPVTYKKLPSLIMRIFMGNNIYKMFKWMDEKSVFRREDLDLSKGEFADLLSLETWIKLNF
jgi:uncharacterized protein YbjT (DUF2867 family)